MEIANRWRWVLSEGRRILEKSQAQDLELRRYLSRELRLNIWQTEMLCEQQQYRQRATIRFPTFSNWIWTDLSLQQATDERSASWIARLFPTNLSVVDACCGAGAQSYALSSDGRKVVALDSDRILCEIARSNCANLNRDVSVVNCQLPGCIRNLSQFGLHIDPDRRSSGKRSIDGDDFSPSLSVCLDLGNAARAALVKVSPGTELSSDLEKGWHRIWIGTARQCPLQILARGEIAIDSEPLERTAILIRNDAGYESFRAIPEHAALDEEIDSPFVVEPHPALYASDLMGAWGINHNLTALTSSEGYYLSDERIESPWAQCFEILEILPWDDRRIRSWLRKSPFDQVEVKKRLIPLDANHFQRRYSTGQGSEVTCLVTRIGKSTRAIMARRIEKEAPPATSV